MIHLSKLDIAGIVEDFFSQQWTENQNGYE